MRIAALLLGLSLLAAMVVAIAGPGYRFDAWPLFQAFDIMRIGAWASAATGVLAILCILYLMWRRRFLGVLLALPAVAVSAAALYVPWQMAELARTRPTISDISTDVGDPPQFVALKAARDQAQNGSGWSGNAELQRQHYLDIAPVTLPGGTATVLPLVEATARDMGWTVALADANAGRLEASHRTQWFGFVDDVVVRLRPEGDKVVVDIRSASRIGANDLGQNAERIRDFLGRLQARAPR